MSNRVKTVISEMHSVGDAQGEARFTNRELILASLRAQFTVSDARLREMAAFMRHEIHTGLEAPGRRHSTLQMIPSFVVKRPTGHVGGTFYALDLGGSNFRVLRLELSGGKVLNMDAKKFVIPAALTTGEGTKLFDFIASSIQNYLEASGRMADGAVDLPLGFTFSFPVQQHGIASGSLIRWTKQFSASGVEGRDVVILLREALKRRSLRLKVVALCNDTVGTLVAKYFSDARSEMGVIIGTGSNACYWEKASRIKKCPAAIALGNDAEMIVNMEYGNFDSDEMLVLPRTVFDDDIDRASENRNKQRFEKMVSGKYLGEIARRVIVHLADRGVVDMALGVALQYPYVFESRFAGTCISDFGDGLLLVKDLFSSVFGVHVTFPDRVTIREACTLVSSRAAKLAGMAVAATLTMSGRQHNAIVAVDGSVFEKQPGFRTQMEDSMRLLLPPDAYVQLELVADGSGIGAAFIAALQ